MSVLNLQPVAPRFRGCLQSHPGGRFRRFPPPPALSPALRGRANGFPAARPPKSRQQAQDLRTKADNRPQTARKAGPMTATALPSLCVGTCSENSSPAPASAGRLVQQRQLPAAIHHPGCSRHWLNYLVRHLRSFILSGWGFGDALFRGDDGWAAAKQFPSKAGT